MEVLQRLTRRQLDVLEVIGARETPALGVSLNEIASSLHVRPPSALAHIDVVETLGLVDRHRGKSRLSPRGRACLDEYYRHHRVAESLFEKLGLPPEATCEAAREVDLALTHRTVERICEAAGHPQLCPHGEPIEHAHRAARRK